ncbi:hypothetical protein [Bradyrhizobium lupini]|uniref:hypothetical protein n=1 Tax=Rhizobium lupini TaxID=136996 RepID=UPI0034C69278
MMAHHFKHVRSDDEKAPHKEGTIPLASAVFGYGTFNTAPFNTMAYNEVGIDLHNISYLIQEVIRFLEKQAEAQ